LIEQNVPALIQKIVNNSLIWTILYIRVI